MTDSYTYYPIFNQLTSHTDGLSHTTSYSDDSFGHLTQITDPLGNAVKFTSDGQGRTTAGATTGAVATSSFIFEGVYDWGVIGEAAWGAISSDDCGCQK
ncbi:hypothetical protein NUH87_05680 [Pseudomonas batumici]|uniref:RHS repeat domain-containing protein n=1 Tax=Pseudomonas batumici TaxID=226910 RepID=UPI0030D342B9